LVVAGGAEYLGVRFVGSQEPESGVPGEFLLSLAYHPQVDYLALAPGTAFTGPEGARVVGAGRVLGPGEAVAPTRPCA
jgi:hypothetical protein